MKTFILCIACWACYMPFYAQTRTSCETSQTITAYGDGTKKESISYFKNCTLHSIHCIYTDGQGIEYKTTEMIYSADGYKKSAFETYHGMPVYIAKYDRTGALLFEKLYTYNRYGELLQIETKRQNVSTFQTFERDEQSIYE